METGTGLTEMEARILEKLAVGERTADIARQVYLSRQGVEFHVSKLLQRMRVPNRTALVARAYSMGILSAPSWPPRVGAERARLEAAEHR